MNEIIFWGCGKCGEFVYEQLHEELGERLVAFGESDPNKIGREYMGKPIVSAKDVIQKFPEALIIITVMKEDNNQIKEDLRKKGIENKIVSYKEVIKPDSVEQRRMECANYHIDCMDDYFESAEDKRSLDTFWGEHSPFRRLFDKLDASYIVELACGRGRHVPQYMDRAEHIVVVDILEKNIQLCRERFKDIDKIDYYVNSGYDLKDLKDESNTAIFSYDAMVHFESIDIYYYLQETARILKSGGMALYHHSNMDKDYRATFLSAEAGRNYMSMSLFAHFADRARLEVVEQVEYPRGNVKDAISLLKKP